MVDFAIFLFLALSLFIVPLMLVSCSKKKTNDSTASVVATPVSATQLDTPSSSKPIPPPTPKEKLQNHNEELKPDKTQEATPETPAKDNNSPPMNSIDALDVDDDERDTLDDAPSLKYSRPDLASVKMVAMEKKPIMKSADLLKLDPTMQSERTVREVRDTKKKPTEIVTAKEKKRNGPSKKKKKTEVKLASTQD